MREKETFRSINELITYLAGPTAPGLALHDRIDVNSGLIAFFRPPFKVDFAKRPSYGQSSNRCSIIVIALNLSGSHLTVTGRPSTKLKNRILIF